MEMPALRRLGGLCLPVIVVVTMAEGQVRFRDVGFRAARLVVEDSKLPAGASVWIAVTAEQGETEFREGVIEGFLAEGLKPFSSNSGDQPDIEGYSVALVIRGRIDGAVRVSAVVEHIAGRVYISSREYVLPSEEESFIGRVIGPIVLTSAAVLAVYLLLTVRSS